MSDEPESAEELQAANAAMREEIGAMTSEVESVEAEIARLSEWFHSIDRARDRYVTRVVPIVPQDLPKLREDQVNAMEREGALLVWSFSKASQQADDDRVDGHEAFNGERGDEARVIATEQIKAFRRAELLFVSESLARLLEHGHEGMGEAGFERSDLPSDYGMAYLDLDMPLNVGDREAQQGERLLFVWRHVPEATDQFPRGRVEVTAYQDRDRSVYVAYIASSGKEQGKRWRELPRFLWDDAVSIGYGDVAVDVPHHHKRNAKDDRAWWQQRRGPMFRALCYLLNQRVTIQAVEQPTRATRKLIKRAGGEPAPIRVIALRGATSGGPASASDREYVHQWMVRGHWRRQWYRSIEQHRPVFIAPYVKGPEGAPLLGGEKVYRASAPSDSDS